MQHLEHAAGAALGLCLCILCVGLCVCKGDVCNLCWSVTSGAQPRGGVKLGGW